MTSSGTATMGAAGRNKDGQQQEEWDRKSS
jgi:hypothetical protein